MLILDVFPVKNNQHMIAKTDVWNEKEGNTTIFREIWQFSFSSGMALQNCNAAKVFWASGKVATSVKLFPEAKGLVYFLFWFNNKYS